jgi:hypothetical protein
MGMRDGDDVVRCCGRQALCTLVVIAVAAVTLVLPGSAAASDPVVPGPVDRAFQRLYNFDFPGSLSILDEAGRSDPQNPLIPSVRAAAYLFMELDRLKVLETRFFMNDDNMVDGSSRPKPDPAIRAKLFGAFAASRQLAAARLAANPEDETGLLALSMSAGLETDYAALVEGRTWRSMKLAPASLAPAKKLVSRTPPVYDAYVTLGATEYIVGNLPFFVRWFVHYDGIEGDKRRGIEQVKLAARHGRYYGPFARILLAVASLRDKKFADAHQVLSGLVEEFPENPLFRKELSIISERMRRARR